MTDAEKEESLPWLVQESPQRLELCHDHRWLAILGVPLAVAGLAAATGLWFLPDLDYGEHWPILAVGSLIGLGMVLMGLHLSLNREFFIADRGQRQLIHRSGFGPFTRTRRYAWNDIRQVVCARLPGQRNYFLIVEASGRRILLAQAQDLEPVQLEGLRWSLFLDVPLADGITGGVIGRGGERRLG